MTESDATRYPVYVVSKGRHDVCLTARFLIRDRVPFRLVVEPQEVDLYAAEFGRERLLVLPFSHRGLPPVRNWVWEHAIASGSKRHWTLDDNIIFIWRRWKARKIPCEAGPALRAVENFVDRYENIALAGLNYYMFSANRMKQPPFVTNCHVYSFMLIQNDCDLRFRGKYNEDVDFCLQLLASGRWCTVLFNAFLAWKMTTMTMKGGCEQLYKGDGRLKASRFLERAWPGVVSLDRRFQRPHHVVKDAWRKFDTPLKRRTDIDWGALEASGDDEFGMSLRQREGRETKNPTLKRLIAGRLEK